VFPLECVKGVPLWSVGFLEGNPSLGCGVSTWYQLPPAQGEVSVRFIKQGQATQARKPGISMKKESLASSCTGRSSFLTSEEVVVGPEIPPPPPPPPKNRIRFGGFPASTTAVTPHQGVVLVQGQKLLGLSLCRARNGWGWTPLWVSGILILGHRKWPLVEQWCEFVQVGFPSKLTPAELVRVLSCQIGKKQSRSSFSDTQGMTE